MTTTRVPANGAYTKFLDLPAELHGASGTSSSVPTSIPPHLLGGSCEEFVSNSVIFPYAREVLEKLEQRKLAQKADAESRKGRKDLMEAILHGAVAPPFAVHSAPASREPQVDHEDAIRQVLMKTGLPADRCRFYLEQHDWDIEKAVHSIGEVGAAAPPSKSDVVLEFCTPDGRKISHVFRITQGPFEVYSKAFEMLHNKDLAFTIRVVGPVGAEQQIDKILDEATWSCSLLSTGIVAGQRYTVYLTQDE